MSRKLTYEEVKEFIENNGCKLISEEYVNNYTKLKIQCSCGEMFEKSFGKFKNNQRQCKKCGIEITKTKQKLTYEEVKGFIEDNGCKLISEEYVNAHTKLKIQCSCGEVFEKDFKSFKNNQRQCKKCGIEITKTKQKLTYEEVKGFIEGEEGNGCKLISEEYVNAYIKLKIKCSCGEMFEKSFSNFKDKNQRQCKKCGIAKISGENNCNYNPNLTDEERESERLIPNYGEFIRKTYERDNYSCQCCGQKGGKLNAHHLNGYSWDKEHRTTSINGVTLCKKCHNEFHSIYGYGNNTIIQFRGFIRNKYLQTKDPKYLTVLKDIDIRITLLVDNSTLSKEII